MYLENLKIFSFGVLIREVTFKQGVNLIIDSVAEEDITSSGNSVGKTTLLRVVDFCFGSEGEDIYTDEETGDVNEKVLDYLQKNDITAVLKISFDDKSLVLARSFGTVASFKVGDRDFETLDDYKKHIEVSLFNIKSSEPTLRQVMPKFIRKTDILMSRAVQFQHSGTTPATYELIYAYLFGAGNQKVLIERYSIKKELTKVKARIKALKNRRTVPALKQVVKALSREILDLEKQKDSYDVDALYDEKMAELRELKTNASKIAIEISSLETDLTMHENTISELRGNISQLDPRVLREMYSEAGMHLGALDKQFEELFNFHNDLVVNKIEFVSGAAKRKVQALDEFKKQHKNLLSKERELLQFISKKGALDDLEGLYGRIIKLSEERGRKEQLIVEIAEATEEKDKLEDSLEKLSDDFDKIKAILDENIAVFNIYFTEFAKKLYNENFLFVYDDSGASLKFKIENRDSNAGGGKKKAYVTAFDFAYASYLTDKDINLPRFIMHDSIEDVANNQLKTLFDIADAGPMQYVFTIIRDRLDSRLLDEVYVKQLIQNNKILELNQNDKFFKFD